MTAVVASVLAEGGTAIALDDGTVWLVHDGEADPLGACDDGEVVSLAIDDDELIVSCGDDTRWSWSDGDGWQELAIDAVDDEPEASRTWWPALDLAIDRQRRGGEPPAWQGWVRLRWDL